MPTHLKPLFVALAFLVAPLNAIASDPPSGEAAGLPAVKPAKLEAIKNPLAGDGRLRLIQSKGTLTVRCAAADVGHFVILTSYRCLSAWWNDKGRNQVGYSTDIRRDSTHGIFTTAHRDVDPFSTPRWGMLETAGHTGGFLGYRDLSTESAPLSRTYTFVGVSPKVKNGRELAVQKDCHIDRTKAGAFVSLCGAGFDESGFLILSGTGADTYVYGLATVAREAKIGKRLVYTLKVTSNAAYGQTLAGLRQSQTERYQAQLDRDSATRRAAAARQRDHDHHDLDHRPRHRSGPRASEVLLQGLSELADTLNRNRNGLAPAVAAEAPAALPVPPTGLTGRDRYAVDSNAGVGNSKWYPSGWVDVAAGQTTQVWVVDSRGNRVAYLNISLGHPAQSTEALKLWESYMSVFAGNTSHCDLQVDGTLDVNGSTWGFFNGVGGSKVPPMSTRSGGKTISYPRPIQTIRVSLDAFPMTCR